jgi:DNA-binding SARP family transcriptional activator
MGDRSLTRFRTQKNAVLLAYLAYYRHQQHPREVLIEMLWPDCAPEVGRNRLSTALWWLRRNIEEPLALEEPLFQADHFAVGVNLRLVTTDVAGFLAAVRKAVKAPDRVERAQHLAEALELYRGELLPGFYEDWVLR